MILEPQILQTQKMEALGRLAGGVAHDFNNLLTIINGCSDLVLQALPPSGNIRELVQEVRQAGQRAAELTRQLLAFSRREPAHPQALHLNDIVERLHKMLARLVGEHIEVQAELYSGPTLVRVDPGQMEQVIFNLAANARDAMPAGGQLLLQTQRRASSPPNADAPRDYVVLNVSDTGQGIP